MMTRYVLIGMGIAAISALESIRSVDDQGEILVISDDPYGYYSRPGLAYYLTGELEEKQLYPYQKEDFLRLRAQFIRGRVVKVDPEERQAALEDGTFLGYDKLLIATGAQAASLHIPGTDLRGVHKLDHLADARAMLGNARRGGTAVVTGGGITALEIAEGLAARGMNVHYVMRSHRYWPSVLEEAESEIVESLLARENIQIFRKSELAEIVGRNGRVVGARLADGRSLKAELAAFAIGVSPRIALAQQLGLRCERGILVNEYMETSLADIYAAGDVAQVFDPASGKHLLDSLWGPALEQGRTAGLNMAGRRTPYQKPAALNVTRLAGLTVTIIGAVSSPSTLSDHKGEQDLLSIARGDSETWRQLPDCIIAQSGFDVNHMRLMIGEKHILGAVVMGDQKLSAPLQKIIRQKVEITPIREQLLAPQASLADVLVQFVHRTQIS